MKKIMIAVVPAGLVLGGSGINSRADEAPQLSPGSVAPDDGLKHFPNSIVPIPEDAQKFLVIPIDGTRLRYTVEKGAVIMLGMTDYDSPTVDPVRLSVKVSSPRRVLQHENREGYILGDRIKPVPFPQDLSWTGDIITAAKVGRGKIDVSMQFGHGRHPDVWHRIFYVTVK